MSANAAHVAFLGADSAGKAGIYLASGISRVVGVDDLLDGKTVAELRLGSSGLEGGWLTFSARFTDGSEGVYTVNVKAFNFSSFFQPVDNLPVVNQVKAGQGVPVKFSLNGYQGLNIFSTGYPRSEQIACNSSAFVDGVEVTATADQSTLSYDSASDQCTYVWKTDKSWSNTCRQLILRFTDGSQQRANFTLK